MYFAACRSASGSERNAFEKLVSASSQSSPRNCSTACFARPCWKNGVSHARWNGTGLPFAGDVGAAAGTSLSGS